MKKYEAAIKSYINGEALITFISEDIGELSMVMDFIGENDELYFDSAAPMNIRPNSNVVLTTTSICMLHRYNILKDLDKFMNPYVLRGMINKIKSETNIIQNNIKKEELKDRFSISDDNNLNRLDYLNKKLIKLEEILSIIEKFNVIDIYKPMEENILSTIVPNYDVEAAQYAKSHNMYLVVDDIGSLGLFETFIENKKIVNSSGILNHMILTYGNLTKYKDSLLKMINDKYLFSIDFRSLCMIIGICFEEKEKELLKNIIFLLLEKDYNKQYYRLLKAYLEISPNSRYLERQLIEEIIKKIE